MSNPYAHYRAGDKPRFPHTLLNELIDNLGSKTGGGTNAQPPETSVEILIRNDSGGDVGRFGVLSVGESVFDPTTAPSGFKNNRIFSGDAPTSTALICVTQEPIRDGGIGRAVILGVTQCTIAVTDAAHEFADTTTSTEKLASATEGRFLIIDKEGGTGDKLAAVLLLPEGYVPDAAYQVGGKINDSPQYLGYDVKTVYGLTVSRNADSSGGLTIDTGSGVLFEKDAGPYFTFRQAGGTEAVLIGDSRISISYSSGGTLHHGIDQSGYLGMNIMGGVVVAAGLGFTISAASITGTLPAAQVGGVSAGGGETITDGFTTL